MAVEYAHAHWVFRILGFFGASETNNVEPWSTGFRIGHEGTDVSSSSGNMVNFLESVASDIQTFHSLSGAKVGSTCFLSELTIARVGTDGKYNPASQETIRREYPTPIAGSGGNGWPWSQALVISLRTKYPRGIGSNGRTYWPCTAMPVDPNTGRISPSNVYTFAQAASNMVKAINTDAELNLDAGSKVIVAGATGKKGPARNAYVTEIRVDNRLDSIERRENAQETVWQTFDV